MDNAVAILIGAVGGALINQVFTWLNGADSDKRKFKNDADIIAKKRIIEIGETYYRISCENVMALKTNLYAISAGDYLRSYDSARNLSNLNQAAWKEFKKAVNGETLHNLTGLYFPIQTPLEELISKNMIAMRNQQEFYDVQSQCKAYIELEKAIPKELLDRTSRIRAEMQLHLNHLIETLYIDIKIVKDKLLILHGRPELITDDEYV